MVKSEIILQTYESFLGIAHGRADNIFRWLLLRRDHPDLEQPLLEGDGDGEEVEDVKQEAVPKPPNLPSSFDLSDTAGEGSPSQPEPRTWKQWFKTSPFVPTSCCIFLCFILKVVQQVGLPTALFFHKPKPFASPPWILILA